MDIKPLEIEESCKYVGAVIPAGQAYAGRIPRYPDPEIYSPEVIKGFPKWPELYFDGKEITYRLIDPSDDPLRDTLIMFDTKEEVLALLGEPPTKEYVEAVKAWRYRYSDKVLLWIIDDALNCVNLPKYDPADDLMVPWKFVFVQPQNEVS